METAVPFTVILPACDRDVADLAGQFYYEQALMKLPRDDLTASLYLAGANHNRFNSQLEDESLGPASAVCDEALLSAETQQEFLADYAPHFFDAILGRGDGNTAVIGIDATQPAPATLFGQDVLTSLALPTTQRLVLPMYVNGATGSATALLCEQGYALAEDKMGVCRLRFNQPGNPEELALTWDGADGVYTVALPEGKRDLSGYGMLHLRTAVDPVSLLNEPGQPQSFSVRLTDGTGKTAVVTLKGEPALAFPAGEKDFDDYFKVETWDNDVILSSIRVPLEAFSGVDLSDIQSIDLVFDANDSGAIFLADLELLQR